MFWKASLLSLALPAYAAVHESIAAAPEGWTKTSLLSKSSNVRLQVALQYNNIESLESKLLEVSDPASASYGKYLDKDDVEALFEPAADSISKVKSWVAGAGAEKVEYSSGILSFTTSVEKANSLLSTEFDMYTDGNTMKVRTLQYSVPDELSDIIDLVSPTTYFGTTRAHAAVQRMDFSTFEVEERASPEELAERQDVADTHAGQLNPSCLKKIKFDNQTYEVIGPECLKELYSIGNYKPDAKSGSSVAFGSFLNESASYSDLAKFEKIYNIPSQKLNILALINGGTNDQKPLTEIDGEANLDAQNILGLVNPIAVGEYITGGSPPFIPDLLSPNASENTNEPYLPYYQYLLSQKNANLPLVISNSYGDHENTVPPKYANRVCNMIGMMGMRGRSILESSGDEGTGAVCLTNQGKKRPEFTPIFPATCPYVTSVGGTQFYNPENAWNASSGGFSNYFGIPSYQKSAVATYLSSRINPVAKKYYEQNQYANFSGRGFPDVSAHSLYPFYLTVINGTAVINGGTSAASPVFAAVITLVNDALLKAGKSPLGYLNPFLYSKAAPARAINDITEGGSLGCLGYDLQNGIVIKGAGKIKYASWNATKGWDPVTGLGTPNFNALMKLTVGSAPSGYGN